MFAAAAAIEQLQREAQELTESGIEIWIGIEIERLLCGGGSSSGSSNEDDE